ncbi:MAG: 2-C-methyl-D-erythritol 4-phosphate cytidylyltransferase [Candidatus Eremiobacteraeota bacterium]|nr:2-C-methyl-D-erythritol 4-phosphate cytidylyltransferase [Candidatus Eremiobacteraeota bacterium]
MSWAAAIVAAGRGTRLGRPKQLIDVAGIPLAGWAMRSLATMPEIVDVVIVTDPEFIDAMRELAQQIFGARSLRVVIGGATRQASVKCALDVLPARCTHVLVHDGARPLVRARDVRAGMAKVAAGRGAVLATPVVDTIKIVDPRTMTVVETLPRGALWAAQTPQFATRADFERAHAEAAVGGIEATDDVALLERIGVEVAIVPSSGENFKVTVEEDLVRAELLLREGL